VEHSEVAPTPQAVGLSPPAPAGYTHGMTDPHETARPVAVERPSQKLLLIAAAVACVLFEVWNATLSSSLYHQLGLPLPHSAVPYCIFQATAYGAAAVLVAFARYGMRSGGATTTVAKVLLVTLVARSVSGVVLLWVPG
jgi:hypothetical protein